MPTKKINADDVFSARKRERPKIDVPEWGVSLRVRKLPFAKMMALSKYAGTIEGNMITMEKENIVQVIIECCYKPDKDEPFFEERHRDSLLEEDFDIVMFVFQEIMKLNGSKEEAEKN